LTLDLDGRDTIAALATASGTGAVAVLRVSGSAAGSLRDRLFVPRRPGAFRPAELRLGDVVDGQPLDEALCAWFPAGRSFTGEPVFELHLHGGLLNTRRVLEALHRAGARPARPGEFTLRAFINGRLDLTQAEAVQQIVSAQSEAALELAQRALRGAAGEVLTPLASTLTELLADLEARLDFPEDDLDPAQRQQLVERVEALRARVRRQRATAATGARLCERPRAVLCGPPNAGKSTLLNALCERDRALTHPEAGTTRDLLEVGLLAGDTELTLVDTAGLRADARGIETEAVARARQAMSQADLRVLVVDASRPLDDDARAALEQLAAPALLVANKRDLGVDPQALAAVGPGALELSALSGAGVEALRAQLRAQLRPSAETLDAGWLVTVERHAELLDRAAAALDQTARLLQHGEAEEVAAQELRRALAALCAITGEDPTEQVLASIFSRFCIGK